MIKSAKIYYPNNINMSEHDVNKDTFEKLCEVSPYLENKPKSLGRYEVMYIAFKTKEQALLFIEDISNIGYEIAYYHDDDRDQWIVISRYPIRIK